MVQEIISPRDRIEHRPHRGFLITYIVFRLVFHGRIKGKDRIIGNKPAGVLKITDCGLRIADCGFVVAAYILNTSRIIPIFVEIS